MNERQRLMQIMEAEGMNAKQFSKEVGISQGTLSNIMSGRNNPSLDVLQAVLNRFRTIQSDWLILGIGAMYRPNGDGPQTALFDIAPVEPSSTEIVPPPTEEKKVVVAEKQVKRIIICYTDGTYEER